MKGQLEEAIQELEAALSAIKQERGDAMAAEEQEQRQQLQQPPKKPQAPPVDLAPGALCRFHYSDGRWYAGRVEAVSADSIASVSFSCPTR
jgi:hypothetical protein